MKVNWTLAVAAVALSTASGAAFAQEFGLYGGPLKSGGDHSYGWAMDYTEGFGKYFAGSITWLNEGHIPDHHRDGQLIQLWARLPLAQRRFVFAVGVGPYRYFDTEQATQGQGYSNDHGWGMVYSARATWYSAHRWTANLQLNRVQVQRGPSTTALMLGVGYQLDAPGTPEVREDGRPATRAGSMAGRPVAVRDMAADARPEVEVVAADTAAVAARARRAASVGSRPARLTYVAADGRPGEEVEAAHTAAVATRVYRATHASRLRKE